MLWCLFVREFALVCIYLHKIVLFSYLFLLSLCVLVCPCHSFMSHAVYCRIAEGKKHIERRGVDVGDGNELGLFCG